MSTASRAPAQALILHRSCLRGCLFMLLAIVHLQSSVWTQEKPSLAAPTRPQVEGGESLRSSGELPIVKPHEVGLSQVGLQRMTDYVREQVDRQLIPGAVMLIARHGKVAYAEAIGEMDPTTGDPLKRDALFRIASMTKAITSVAILQLVEEGKMGLEDQLAKFIPELDSFEEFKSERGPAVTGAKRLPSPTIHQLLTHTSGLTYGWFGPPELDALYRQQGINELFTPVDETIGRRVERLKHIPLVCAPGEAWNYSFSTDVLGRVIEIVSGLPLDVYFRERIFRPLGMHDTYFYVPNDQQSRLATLVTLDADQRLMPVGDQPVERGFLTFAGNYCTAESGSFFSGGSGLVCTADDYMRFLLMLAGGGMPPDTGLADPAPRMLGEASVARMTQNQIGELQIPFAGHGDGFGYGLGVLTQRGVANDIASVGTFSWGGIFNTYYWVDPQEELIGILMTQIFPYDHLQLREKFKELAYAAIDDSGFSKVTWYQPGAEFGNPVFNSREIRVNSPNASIHPTHASRKEPKSSGTARILIEEDLRTIRRAEVYCELWGGHPGTDGKRLTLNGRRTFRFPDVGCRDQQCTHQYATFNLAPSDLVSGYNALQFACDQGDTFWGHYIVDNCALRISLRPDDPRLRELVDGDFRADVKVEPMVVGEGFQLSLDVQPKDAERIAQVDFRGRYYGYDENGVLGATDWHGMTKGREPYGQLGSASAPPFETQWDTSMLPAQAAVSVRAEVRFKSDDSIRYRTQTVTGLQIAPRADGSRVEIFSASDSPKPFWSRAGRKKTCILQMPLEVEAVTACQLHVVAWAGGAGTIQDYFTLNGHSLPIAENDRHQVVYSQLDIPPQFLRRGANVIELLSDTEHHGIEILLPGPALVVRTRGETTLSE